MATRFPESMHGLMVWLGLAGRRSSCNPSFIVPGPAAYGVHAPAPANGRAHHPCPATPLRATEGSLNTG